MTRTEKCLFPAKKTMHTGEVPKSTSVALRTKVQDTTGKQKVVSGTGTGNMSGLPCKSGSVYMVQTVAGRTRRLGVILTVHCTNFDRYLVMSTDKILFKDCGYINLKHCAIEKVKTSEDSFQIVPLHGEGTALTFAVTRTCDLQQWLVALQENTKTKNPLKSEKQLKVPQKSLLLPAVEEGPED